MWWPALFAGMSGSAAADSRSGNSGNKAMKEDGYDDDFQQRSAAVSSR